MANDITKEQVFKDGDFNVGYGDAQHVQDVLVSAPGHIKDAPLIGVNIVEYINAPYSPVVASELERKIRLQLQADGARDITVSVDIINQTIVANGTYN